MSEDDTTTEATSDPGREVLVHSGNAADAQRASAEGDEPTAPQAPGDAGYEPPAIIPELDGKGGTKFVMGDDEFGSMADAMEARQGLLDDHASATTDDTALADTEAEDEPDTPNE